MTGPKILIDRRQLLLGTAGAASLLIAPSAARAAAGDEPLRVGRHQPFDLNWRFHRGAGEDLQARDISDTDWRTIDLPHDWSIEDLPHPSTDSDAKILGPFDRNAIGGTATGYSVGGEGWYRKHFSIDAPANARAEILFEGIYMHSEVWLNGRALGAHPCGYTPFAFDLTPHLVPGNNVLAVHVRNIGKNSRWYSGSGIQRHV
jgi:beta-galactosidase